MNKVQFALLFGGLLGSVGTLLCQWFGRLMLKDWVKSQDFQITFPAGTVIKLDGFPCTLLNDTEVYSVHLTAKALLSHSNDEKLPTAERAQLVPTKVGGCETKGGVA